MCPFLDAPEGMSAETLEMLDNAFFAAWRALQNSQPASKPLEAPLSEPFKVTCDLMSSVARLPERPDLKSTLASKDDQPSKLAITHLAE